MKSLFSTLFILLFSTLLSAQRDTTYLTFAEVPDSLENQTYLARYVFHREVPQRWMVKAAPFFDSYSTGTQLVAQLMLSGEILLKPWLSINAAGTIIYVPNERDFATNDNTFAVQLAAEPRWYYRKNRRLRNQTAADNLSDNYIGLLGTYRHQQVDNILPSFSYNTWGLGLSWGMQRRVLRHGYFDLGLEALYQNLPATPFNRGERFVSIRPRRQLGLALDGSTFRTLDAGPLCAATRCFVQENRMVRVNLSDVLDFRFSPRETQVISRIQVQWEQRLGNKLPLSLVGGVHAGYHFHKVSIRTWGSTGDPFTAALRYSTAQLGVSVEPRFYYRQQHRIRTGQSAANLSGSYVGFAAQFDRFQTHSNSTFYTGSSWAQVYYGVLGFQQRLLRHAYFGLRVELGIRHWQDLRVNPEGNTQRTYLNIPITAGVAF